MPSVLAIVVAAAASRGGRVKTREGLGVEGSGEREGPKKGGVIPGPQRPGHGPVSSLGAALVLPVQAYDPPCFPPVLKLSYRHLPDGHKSSKGIKKAAANSLSLIDTESATIIWNDRDN